MSVTGVHRLRALIRDVPDFPQPGILFRDITRLLADAAAFREAVDTMAGEYQDVPIDLVAGIESRGFVLGAAVAYRLAAGFVPIRKEGRLPAAKISAAYDLEYGRAVLEIHADAVRSGHRVLIVDDLLATGGTASTAASLIEQLGGTVAGLAFLVELTQLGGGAVLAARRYSSIIKY